MTSDFSFLSFCVFLRDVAFVLWENREYCSTLPHFDYIIIHPYRKIKVFSKKDEKFFDIFENGVYFCKRSSIGAHFVVE